MSRRKKLFSITVLGRCAWLLFFACVFGGQIGCVAVKPNESAIRNLAVKAKEVSFDIDPLPLHDVCLESYDVNRYKDNVSFRVFVTRRWCGINNKIGKLRIKLQPTDQTIVWTDGVDEVCIWNRLE